MTARPAESPTALACPALSPPLFRRRGRSLSRHRWFLWTLDTDGDQVIETAPATASTASCAVPSTNPKLFYFLYQRQLEGFGSTGSKCHLALRVESNPHLGSEASLADSTFIKLKLNVNVRVVWEIGKRL